MMQVDHQSCGTRGWALRLTHIGTQYMIDQEACKEMERVGPIEVESAKELRDGLHRTHSTTDVASA